MVLGFHSAMIDENTGIADDSTHGTRTVSVHFDELLATGLRYHQLGRLKLLFDSEDHAFIRLNSDGCRTEL